MNGRRLFFYGTLMDPLILRTVLRRSVDARQLRRAVLPGFRRVFHRGASYPVLVDDAESEVDGILVSDLTQRDVALLTAYEGHDYRLAERSVRLMGGCSIEAGVFLPQRDAVASTTNWARRFRARFLRQVRRHRRPAPVA